MKLDLNTCYYYCPKCDADFIHGHGLVATENDTAIQIVSCDTCKYSWVEVYKFDHNVVPVNKEN